MSDKTIVVPCTEYGHPDFQLVVDSTVPDVDVDTLASFLTESVRGGTRFNDGETIQFGSMLFLVAGSAEHLILKEPDLIAFPIQWEVSITRSLRMMRLQKDIGESLGFDDGLDFPSIRDSLLIGVDLVPGIDILFLERAEISNLDSGWFIGRLDTRISYNDPANLLRVSVYRAILDFPQITGLLALPTGCRVEMPDSRMLFWHNDRPLQIMPGSFLAAALHKREHGTDA